MTVKEAAAASTFSFRYLQDCIRDGRLPLILEPGPRGRSIRMIRAEDLEALEPLRARATVTRAQQIEVHARMGGKKCTNCGAEKPLDDFPKEKRGLFGRRGNCKRCDAKRWDNFYEGHREERLQYLRDYGIRHRDRLNTHRRDYNRRVREAGGECYQRKLVAWRLTNERRASDAAYMRRKIARDRMNQRALVAMVDGKNSPITKRTGFALVCTGDQFRAARLDQPLSRGERKIAEFACPFGAWVVLRQALALTYDEERLFRLLQARETRDVRHFQRRRKSGSSSSPSRRGRPS